MLHTKLPYAEGELIKCDTKSGRFGLIELSSTPIDRLK